MSSFMNPFRWIGGVFHGMGGDFLIPDSNKQKNWEPHGILRQIPHETAPVDGQRERLELYLLGIGARNGPVYELIELHARREYGPWFHSESGTNLYFIVGEGTIRFHSLEFEDSVHGEQYVPGSRISIPKERGCSFSPGTQTLLLRVRDKVTKNPYDYGRKRLRRKE